MYMCVSSDDPEHSVPDEEEHNEIMVDALTSLGEIDMSRVPCIVRPLGSQFCKIAVIVRL
jgi:hypothetical protein